MRVINGLFLISKISKDFYTQSEDSIAFRLTILAKNHKKFTTSLKNTKRLMKYVDTLIKDTYVH